MDKLEKIVKKHQDGAVLNLFITPESSSYMFPAGINQWRKCIEMKICSPPKNNLANKDVIKNLADFFDKPINNIFIVSGTKNRVKKVLIKGASVDFISNKLRKSLDGL